MTKHYLAMTKAEFEAYGDAIRKQIDRVHRRALIYAVLLLIVGVPALSVALYALAAPSWLTLPASLVLGVGIAKAGVWLSWLREGERLAWAR